MDLIIKIAMETKKVDASQLMSPQVELGNVPGKWLVGSITGDDYLKRSWGLSLRSQTRVQRFVFEMQQKYPGQPIPQALAPDDILHGNHLHNLLNFALSSFWHSVADRWPQSFGWTLSLCNNWEVWAAPPPSNLPRPPFNPSGK